MIAILFLLITAVFANNLPPPDERAVVYRMSADAIRMLDERIDNQAEEIAVRIYEIFHPLQKGHYDPDTKREVKAHLYEKLGKPIMEEIPFKIRAAVEKESNLIKQSIENIPLDYDITEREMEVLEAKISRAASKRIASTIQKDVNGRWDNFKKERAEQGRRENDGLMKRDGNIFDKIREKYKFFTIVPGEKRGWIPFVINIAFALFIFGLLLPEMTIAAGVWGTLIQLGIVYPVVNKLFHGFFYFNSANPRDARWIR